MLGVDSNRGSNILVMCFQSFLNHTNVDPDLELHYGTQE